MSYSKKLALRSHPLTPPERPFVDHVLLRAAIAALALVPAASFADTRGGGRGTTTNVTVDNEADEGSDIWDTLLSEALTLDFDSNITVTACSDVENPKTSTTNRYFFDISLNDTSPGLDNLSQRVIDELFDDPAEDDPEVVHVCSTRFFLNVAAGDHTIRWLGAKAEETMADVVVRDTSLTIQAFDGSRL